MNEHTCSDDFFEAFRDGFGSFDFTCQCGRRYFAVDEMFQEDRADFEAARSVNPEKNIEVGGSLHPVDIGPLCLHDCPCGLAKKHEDWIWEHRSSIAKYLKARTQKEMRAAERQLSECGDIPT